MAKLRHGVAEGRWSLVECLSPPTAAVRELITALDTAVIGLLEAPAGDSVVISSVVLVDNADLAIENDAPSPVPDLYLHVGVTGSDACENVSVA